MAETYQLYKDLAPAIRAALRDSINRFGVLVPVTIDQHGNILDGHQRVQIAGELDVDYPTRVVSVADDAEAREIARTLNEDRRAMPKAERLPVETHLREQGHSYRAIAGAVGVSQEQVRQDLSGVNHLTPATTTGRDGKSYPARREPQPTRIRRSSDAAAARREHMRALAAEGCTSHQIAEHIGLSFESVRNIARKHDIDVPADAVVGRARRPDINRIIEGVVSSLEAEVLSLNLIPDGLPSIDPEQAHAWAESLDGSLRALRRFTTKLRRMEL